MNKDNSGKFTTQMSKEELIPKIIELYEKYGQYTIVGKELGIDRRTVKKYLEENNIEKSKNILDENRKDLIIKAKTMYEIDKLSLRKISTELKLDIHYISKKLKELGVEIKSRNIISEDKIQQAKELYENSNILSVKEIAKNLNIDRGQLSKHLKEAGVNIKYGGGLRNYFNENNFEIIDTEEKAYWLGFLYADGCVHKDNNRISLALDIKDLEHVKKFYDFMNASNEIYISEEKNEIGKNKQYCCLTLGGSLKMKNDLAQLGCIPQKTFKIECPTEKQISQELFRHFVRGYVDGDGSLTYNKTLAYPVLQILGTEALLKGIINRMNWKNTNLTFTKNIFMLRYTDSNMSSKYMVELYDNSNIYLDRKFMRFQELYKEYLKRTMEVK